MAVLVTGAAGFIGSSTARALLERGDDVVGIDNLNDYYDPSLKQARLDNLARQYGNRFRFERVDFADAEALQAPGRQQSSSTASSISGAQAGVRYSIENPQAYVQSNLVGHCNMLELARASGPRHMVYASSSSVYGGNKNLPFRVEDRVDHPLSLYAATKKADELHQRILCQPLSAAADGPALLHRLRPLGTARHGDVDLHQGAVRRRAAAAVQRRRDAPRLHLYRRHRPRRRRLPRLRRLRTTARPRPAGAPAPHALYNIGNSRSEDLMRVVELLEQATGTKALLDPQPMQPGDVKDTFADISAIERDLGFAPATTIDEGVPRFVAWYREYHKV